MRHFIRLLLLSLALAPLPALSATKEPIKASAAAYTSEGAKQYVENVAAQAMEVISSKSLSKDQRTQKLNALFAQEVDIEWIGRFVVGRYWRAATDQQKSRYMAAYKDFLITHYTSRFTEYNGGGYKVTESKSDEDDGFVVTMEIISPEQSQPIIAEYRVHKSDKGAIKVSDIIVEGISMITTQRSEFGAVIGSDGFDALIDKLASKKMTVSDMPKDK